MEIRNGVLHVKVNLKDCLKNNIRLQVKPLDIPHNNCNKKHRSNLSLSIPSESSPRLIKVKENINQIKQHQELNKARKPECKTKDLIPASKSAELLVKQPTSTGNKCEENILRYYKNLYCLPTDLDDINFKLFAHSRKFSCQTTRNIPTKRIPLEVRY